jgi:hypothetical protein
MNILLYITVLILFLFCSCNKEKSNTDSEINKYTFEQLDYKYFHLDENTTQVSNYMQLFTINDTLIFSLFNPAMYDVLIYDINTGDCIDKIHLFKEGPNAVTNGIQGYYIINKDSIYLYDYWLKNITLINKKGEILEKIELVDKFETFENNNIISNSPFPLSDLPIHIINNNMILQGMDGMNSHNLKNPQYSVTAIYNLSTDRIYFRNFYPDIYGKNNLPEKWGAFSYRVVPYDINSEYEMVLSYPADDSISVYNMFTDETKRYYAGSSGKYKISPMNKNATRAVQQVHYLEHAQYAGIFYDKYNKLYYRLILKPLKEYNLNDNSSLLKELSVIILDDLFNKVGEYDLIEKTDKYRACFVTSEGLYINILSEDDDFLKFITLKIDQI